MFRKAIKETSVTLPESYDFLTERKRVQNDYEYKRFKWHNRLFRVELWLIWLTTAFIVVRFTIELGLLVLANRTMTDNVEYQYAGALLMLLLVTGPLEMIRCRLLDRCYDLKRWPKPEWQSQWCSKCERRTEWFGYAADKGCENCNKKV